MSGTLPEKATPGGEAGRSRREPGVGATRHGEVYHSGRLMRAAWWWIDRWRKSTAYTDMTLAEMGAYRNLLDELWLRDGVIPNDERILAKVCGDALGWAGVRDKVLAHFRLTPEGWRNDTHDEVSAWPKAQAEKGRKRADQAPREGGRFTSPTSPAPAEPPAQHQPPYSVSVLRTPYPLPEPETNNGNEPAPAVADALEKPSWSQEACSDWQRLLGTPPGGRIGHALKALVGKHGWAVVRSLWVEACERAAAEPDPSFFTPEVFARTFQARLSAPPGARAGPGVIARGQAEAEKFLQSRRRQ